MYDRGLLPSGVTNPSSVNDDYREEYHTPKRPQYPNNVWLSKVRLRGKREVKSILCYFIIGVFFQSEQFERRKPPPSGRSDRYDFDAWLVLLVSDIIHFTALMY